MTIRHRGGELRVLAAATAVQWGRVYAVKNLTDDGSSAREIRAIAANGVRKFDTTPAHAAATAYGEAVVVV